MNQIEKLLNGFIHVGSLVLEKQSFEFVSRRGNESEGVISHIF